MREWVRTFSGRRYRAGRPKLRREGDQASTPTDERVNLPKEARTFSERDLGGGISLTSWEDPPAAEAPALNQGEAASTPLPPPAWPVAAHRGDEPQDNPWLHYGDHARP
jgi:hypothetical protein